MKTIYTDLDGTLFAHKKYHIAKTTAKTMRTLDRNGIPLIFVSSKTAPEIIALRTRARNNHPFICENGAAIFIPQKYFPFKIAEAKKSAKYFIIRLGQNISKVRTALKRIRKKGFAFKTISGMKTKEIMRFTRLGKKAAELAKKRQYSEALLIEKNGRKNFEREAEKNGLNCIQGGLFTHVSIGGGKGKALKILQRFYAKKNGKTRSIAIGDSENDIEMLKAADFGILVKKHNGKYASNKFAKAKEWNDAVEKGLAATAQKE